MTSSINWRWKLDASDVRSFEDSRVSILVEALFTIDWILLPRLTTLSPIWFPIDYNLIWDWIEELKYDVIDLEPLNDGHHGNHKRFLTSYSPLSRSISTVIPPWRYMSLAEIQTVEGSSSFRNSGGWAFLLRRSVFLPLLSGTPFWMQNLIKELIEED